MTEHDPGGKIMRPLPEGMGRAATFSDCGRYRYDLQRWWGEGKGTVLWIGMNPSTADADHDDPTCQFERRYTERMGYEHYVKCNVLAWRATHPKQIPNRLEKNHIKENLYAIACHAMKSDFSIAAWGGMPRIYDDIVGLARDTANGVLMGWEKRAIYCLGRTQSGAPRHPSRLGYNAELEPF